MIIVKIIYWLFFIGLGFSLIKYRRVVKSWTWNFVWAEKYLWSGWTYLFIILLWMWLIFYWVIYPFWWLEILIPTDSKSIKWF